jgi:hypothetical protein
VQWRIELVFVPDPDGNGWVLQQGRPEEEGGDR